jgi:hypothetical protein
VGLMVIVEICWRLFLVVVVVAVEVWEAEESAAAFLSNSLHSVAGTEDGSRQPADACGPRGLNSPKSKR